MSKERAPAFQLYAADVLADANVVVLTNEELGAYFRLICHCWREGSLPNNSKKLAKLSSSGRRWKRISESVLPLFLTNTAGDLIHKRLDEEREKQRKRREALSAAGNKGAKARWGRDSQAMATPIASDGLSSSSSTSTSNNVNNVREDDEATKGKESGRPDWRMVDHVGELLSKLRGAPSMEDHPNRGYHVHLTKHVPRHIIHGALMATQDAVIGGRNGERDNVNPDKYFSVTVTRMAEEQGYKIPRALRSGPSSRESEL